MNGERGMYALGVFALVVMCPMIAALVYACVYHELPKDVRLYQMWFSMQWLALGACVPMLNVA